MLTGGIHQQTAEKEEQKRVEWSAAVEVPRAFIMVPRTDGSGRETDKAETVIAYREKVSCRAITNQAGWMDAGLRGPISLKNNDQPAGGPYPDLTTTGCCGVDVRLGW